MPSSCGSCTLLSALLLTLLLCRVPSSWAAPAPQSQSQEAGTLSKIYPRGSHWAVGHLMGKKSSGDFPYGYEGGEKSLSTEFAETHKQFGRYPHMEDPVQNLLRILEGNDNRSGQFVREDVPVNNRKPWEADDNSNFKEMMLDFLIQAMNLKESSPS